MALASFSAIPGYQIDVDAAVQSQNQAGNYSIIYWRVLVRKSGTTGHTATINNGNTGRAESNTGELWRNDNMSYNFADGSMTGEYMIADGTFRVNHNAQGQGSYFFSAWLDFLQLGSASATTGWRNLPGLATQPPPPRPLGIDSVMPDSFRYGMASNGDGGRPILEWQAGYGRNPNSPEWYATIGANGYVYIGALLPNTKYYVWSRGRNELGWGGWSTPLSTTTLPGARIRVDGQWRTALPYVKVNGVWRTAIPYVKHNGSWKQSV